MKVSTMDNRVSFIQTGLERLIDECREAGIELELIADQVLRGGEELVAQLKADGREAVHRRRRHLVLGEAAVMPELPIKGDEERVDDSATLSGSDQIGADRGQLKSIGADRGQLNADHGGFPTNNAERSELAHACLRLPPLRPRCWSTSALAC